VSGKEVNTADEPLHPSMRGRANRTQVQQIFTRIVEHLYEAGYITDEDLSDPERLREKVSDLRAAGIEFKGVLDHRDDLVSDAERYSREGKLQMALMLYALFFEHTLNQLILRGMRDARRSQNTADAVLRSVNFDGKLSWILDILDMPPLNEAHRKTMARVAQQRNAFVHYKWKEMTWGEASKREREEADELLRSARKAVAYLKRYESRLALRGKKGLIRELTRLEIPKVPPLKER